MNQPVQFADDNRIIWEWNGNRVYVVGAEQGFVSHGIPVEENGYPAGSLDDAMKTLVEGGYLHGLWPSNEFYLSRGYCNCYGYLEKYVGSFDVENVEDKLEGSITVCNFGPRRHPESGFVIDDEVLPDSPNKLQVVVTHGNGWNCSFQFDTMRPEFLGRFLTFIEKLYFTKEFECIVKESSSDLPQSLLLEFSGMSCRIFIQDECPLHYISEVIQFCKSYRP